MGSNKNYVEKVQGLRRSGAAGKHGDRRLKRLKTRAARNQAARRDQEGA